MVSITIKKTSFESVPPGQYVCEFNELELFETSKGKAFRWRFKVTEGDKKGMLITSLSDRESIPSLKNKTGKWMAALAGTTASDGLAVETDNYVGKSYTVIVGQEGRIEMFFPVN